jgi:hypothetical protein
VHDVIIVLGSWYGKVNRYKSILHNTILILYPYGTYLDCKYQSIDEAALDVTPLFNLWTRIQRVVTDRA